MPCSTSSESVATDLAVSGTMVVQAADRLETDTLIDRRRDTTDRRILRLTTTPAGPAAAAHVRRLLTGAAARFTAPLPADVGRDLKDLLRRLLADLPEPDQAIPRD